MFLQYYFGSLAKKLNVSISIFDPPTNSKKNTSFKSISEEYLKFIAQSKVFKNDLLTVVREKLLLDCQKQLKKKIVKLFLKFEHIYEQ